MRAVAAFDVGTTAVKAVLTDIAGNVLFEDSVEIETHHNGTFHEQEPEDWWCAFARLTRELCRVSLPAAVCMSGQMQDLIPLDAYLKSVRPAILYSDGRAAAEASEIADAVGADTIASITGNPFDGSIPLSKMLWMRRHEPEAFARARWFLISSKDYVNARLTGAVAGDTTACSTAGCMDIHTCRWDARLLAAAGVEMGRMPALKSAHELVGYVTQQAAEETGIPAGTPVAAGVGDAGATSLASGLSSPGEYNINLGTSGWVAAASSEVLRGQEGVFNLRGMPEGNIINVVPFLNGAGVHKWVSALCGSDGAPDYGEVERRLKASAPGAGGMIALPYLLGERFPVSDPSASGAYIGITMNTTRADMTRAMLEGVAFSICQGIRQLPNAPQSITLIGGGGRAEGWRQIMADALGQPVTVLTNSERLPAQAIAAAAWRQLGELAEYDSFVKSLLARGGRTYIPDARVHVLYAQLSARQAELYKALKPWFSAGR